VNSQLTVMPPAKPVISKTQLRGVFHLSLTAAAEQIGVSVEILRKACQKHGIMRWPYRKVTVAPNAS